MKPAYFQKKYGVNILQRFREPLESLEADGWVAEVSDQVVALNRQGLLRVDTLLPRFFQPQHTGIRYT